MPEMMENMKKVWALERKEGDHWSTVICSMNYFRFCSDARKELDRADSEAASELKKEIGEVSWSPVISDRFRKMHSEVRKMFRIVEGQIPKDSKERERYVDNPLVNINEGVYSYEWNNRKRKKKESR